MAIRLPRGSFDADNGVVDEGSDGVVGWSGAGQRLDVRLVPAAVLGWGIAWAAPLLAVVALTSVAGTAVARALLVLLYGWAGRTRSGLIGAMAIGLAGLGMVAGTSAAHVYARDTSPLHVLAASGQKVRVQLRVTEPIRALAPGAAGGRVIVQARVVTLTCSSSCADSAIGSWTLTGRLLVFAPAQDWEQLVPGATVTATVSLAAAGPADLLLGIAFARGPPEVSSPPSGPLDPAANAIRLGLREAADAVLGRDEAGLLRGMVLGDTAGMDAVLVEDFRLSGLSHLTAVSGTNCAIVIGAVLWPLRRSRLRGAARALIAGLCLTGFVVLVGPQPSVLRAAVMGAITLLAMASGRPRQGVPALAATVLVLLAIDPALARDVGFALSVAATAGIVLIARRWAEQLRVRGWPAALAAAFAVCAAAGLVTAPLLVLIAARVSLISLPANLLVVPVVAVVTVFGLAAAVLAPLFPWVAEALLHVTDVPLRWMVWVAQRAARTPGAVLPWPAGVTGALGLALLVVVAVVLLRRRRVRWLAAAACAGLVVSGLTIRALAPAWPPPGWSFVACDVGQGDALVVSVGAGSALVIDTGPDPIMVDGCLRRLGIHDVPLLLLSHLHADHVNGMVGVVRGRTVGALATGPDPPPAQTYAAIGRIAADAGVPVVRFEPGETRVFGSARIEVLGPVARYLGTRSDPNNSSVVTRITVGEVTMLATGDVEVEAQGDLLRRGMDLRADVLKVPHHGSAYQDPAFLAATMAHIAVISVGAGNDYGHPDEVLVDRLRSAGVAVRRTDLDGDIAVVEGNDGLSVVGRGSPIPASVHAQGGLPAAEPQHFRRRQPVSGLRTRLVASVRASDSSRSSLAMRSAAGMSWESGYVCPAQRFTTSRSPPARPAARMRDVA